MSVRRLAAVAILPFVLTSTACYHATIETGSPASADVINQPWALSFVYGLVPPPTVSTASKCPNGVARVETQQSFLNGLVGALTAGLFTPMSITVTCATGGVVRTSSATAAPTLEVDANATIEVKREAVKEAARLAVEGNGTAYVQF